MSEQREAMAFSPTGKKKDSPDDISFFDALKATLEGHKVSKREWDNNNIYIFLDGHLKIMKEGAEVFTLTVREADMLGNDWFILS